MPCYKLWGELPYCSIRISKELVQSRIDTCRISKWILDNLCSYMAQLTTWPCVQTIWVKWKPQGYRALVYASLNDQSWVHEPRCKSAIHSKLIDTNIKLYLVPLVQCRSVKYPTMSIPKVTWCLAKSRTKFLLRILSSEHKARPSFHLPGSRYVACTCKCTQPSVVWKH